MDVGLELLLDVAGDAPTVVLIGVLVGALYGAAAQSSRFCLRAAAVEVARGRFGSRLAVWLLAFSTALFWVQFGRAVGWLDLGEARWATAPGSLSGALLGGVAFGVGMVLARGCPGRLLVLAASGNLRALLSGLVFAVSAQMTLHGVFAPAREVFAQLWVTDGPNPNLLDALGFDAVGGAAIAALLSAYALKIAFANRVSILTLVAGCGVGFAVAVGWWATESLSLLTFEPTPVKSLTFSGPSADLLMSMLGSLRGAPDMDLGLAPGVVLGAAASALWFGDWRLEGFQGGAPMLRQLGGAALMGGGAMLAGGCAIGAGVTGGSVFALTAWVALTAFWAGAFAADYLVDQRPAEEAASMG